MKMNNVDFETYFKHYPDEKGYFGKYGGCYIAPELQAAMARHRTITKSNAMIFFIIFSS